jgi:hypothetical protein
MAERRYLYIDSDNADKLIKEAGAGDSPAGLNRDHIERNTLLSTNSTAYVDVLVLNYTAEAAGDFRIDTEVVWNTDKSNRKTYFELEVDAIVIEENIIQLPSTDTGLRNPVAVLHKLSLTAGAHTVKIRAHVENASQTLDVYHADIFVERWDV